MGTISLDKKDDRLAITIRCRCCGELFETSSTLAIVQDDELWPVFSRWYEDMVCDRCAEKAAERRRMEEEDNRRREIIATISRRLEETGIPPRFRSIPASDEEGEIEKWLARGGNVVLTGDTGTYKTSSVCQRLCRLVSRGVSVRYYTRLADLAAEFQSMKRMDGGDNPERMRSRLNRHAVVCVDEIYDKSGITKMVQEMFFWLLDSEYNGQLTCRLWLVGNVPSKCIDDFGDGPVIRRRLADCFRVGIVKGGKVREVTP